MTDDKVRDVIQRLNAMVNVPVLTKHKKEKFRTPFD